MRVEALFLVFVGLFFGLIGVIYWFWSYEDGGFMMLLGSMGLGLLPGSYYLWWSYHMKPRLEDQPQASIEDGEGTVDAFPSSSIWPFLLGMGAFMATLSFIFGIWFAPIAAALIISGGVGATVESRRGGTV